MRRLGGYRDVGKPGGNVGRIKIRRERIGSQAFRGEEARERLRELAGSRP
jgi:hypothetical protein